MEFLVLHVNLRDHDWYLGDHRVVHAERVLEFLQRIHGGVGVPGFDQGRKLDVHRGHLHVACGEFCKVLREYPGFVVPLEVRETLHYPLVRGEHHVLPALYAGILVIKLAQRELGLRGVLALGHGPADGDARVFPFRRKVVHYVLPGADIAIKGNGSLVFAHFVPRFRHGKRGVVGGVGAGIALAGQVLEKGAGFFDIGLGFIFLARLDLVLGTRVDHREQVLRLRRDAACRKRPYGVQVRGGLVVLFRGSWRRRGCTGIPACWGASEILSGTPC